MKKNILRPILTASLALATIVAPVFAQNLDYDAYNTQQQEYNYHDYEAYNELYLAEGSYVRDGVFYSETFGFSFRIPPLWENNFSIFQHHNNTIFMLNEGDFLFNIAVFDKTENADIYHVVPENFSENFMTLHETEDAIFAIMVYEKRESSTVDSEFFQMMQAPVNGIDDLFAVLDTQIINIGYDYDNYLPQTNYNEFEEINLEPENIDSNIKIVNVDGKDMTPVAIYARELGYEVTWNAYNQTVEFTKGVRVITIQVGNLEYTHNYALGNSSVAPTIYENRVFVTPEFLRIFSR